MQILAYLKRPSTWIILAVGVVLTLAFSRYIPAAVKSAVAKIPGAQPPTA